MNRRELKSRAIATVRAAIKADAPKLVSFRPLGAYECVDANAAHHEFEVNGVHFKTGRPDKECYRFPEVGSETTTLDEHNMDLLLWWLEQEDTQVMLPDPKPYQYLG